MPHGKKKGEAKKQPRKGEKKKPQRATAKPAGSRPAPASEARVARLRHPVQVMAQGRGEMMRGLAASAGRMERAAAQWVAYQNDPFSGKFRGTRVPDALGWATATAELTEPAPSAAPLNITFGETAQFWFAPTFNSAGTIADGPTFAWRTAVGAGAFGAWTLGLSSNQVTVNSNIATLRSVAFGVKFMNITPPLTRGGTVTAIRCIAPGSLPANPNIIRRDPSARVFDMGTATGTVVTSTWEAPDYESALDYHAPNEAWRAGGIVFEVTPAGAACLLDFQCIHGIEFMPTPTQAPIFQVAAIEGSSSAAATVTDYLYNAIGAASGVASDFISDRLAQAAGQLLENLGGNIIPALTAGSSSRATLAIDMVTRRARMRKFIATYGDADDEEKEQEDAPDDYTSVSRAPPRIPRRP